MVSIRVLLVDDHKLVREGLGLLLKFDEQLEVVGEAGDGREAIRLTRALQPDVVLMDLLMPRLDGVSAISIIKDELPAVEIIALTSVLEDSSVGGAVKAGAIGYLLKNTSGVELRAAIHAAAAGQVRLSPEAAVRLMRDTPPNPEVDALTAREQTVLEYLAKGHSNKEIAAELMIGEETVKTHVSRVLGKLGARSRTQAALYAWQNRLVEQ